MDPNEIFEDDDDTEQDAPANERIVGKAERKLKAERKDWRTIAALSGETRNGTQAEDRGFAFTYHAAKGERAWLLDALMPFHETGVLNEVLRVVKGGKEATVYLCTGPGGAHIAAKVYRPRIFRNLRNDAAYRVGTQLRDASGKEMRKSHEMRAVAKRTHFGQQVLHESWLNNEVSALTALTKAGADVPRIHGSGPNAVLMDYIGAPGQPAPPLESADLAPRVAHGLFERALHNIRLMLQNNIVHGDLSGFNILLWRGDLRVIDFPQASNPYRNPNAPRFFARDVQRVCDCFARWCDVPDAPDLAASIWREVLGAELAGADEIRSGRWNAG